jgi:hypothetical protein
MRAVRLIWKPNVSRRKRADTVKLIRKFYATARDRGDFLELLAGKDDTKFVFIFARSKAFKGLE